MGKDILDTKVSEMTALIKELSPQARVEVSFVRCEDEDAHIRVLLPSSMGSEEVTRIELKIRELVQKTDNGKNAKPTITRMEPCNDRNATHVFKGSIQ